VPSGTATRTPTPRPSPTPAGPTTGILYTVKKGDNLFRIGLAYNVAWQTIAALNGIDPKNPQIVTGQKLTIPTTSRTYKVQKGDTLFSIAARFKVSVTALKAANNLKNNVIFAGQVLRIP